MDPSTGDELSAVLFAVGALGVAVGVLAAQSETALLWLGVMPALVVLPIVVGSLPGAARKVALPVLLLAAGIAAGYLVVLGIEMPGAFNDAHDSCGGASDGDQRIGLGLAAIVFLSAAVYAAWTGYKAASVFNSTRRSPLLIALGVGTLGITAACIFALVMAGGVTSC